ncbi:hypothetical protein JCM10296v2_003463 [Rhodotorula toruloides]
MSTDEPSKCCVCGAPTTKRCQACAQSGFDLFFCSPEHQKLVWSDHKLLCGPHSARAAPLAGLEDPISLAGLESALMNACRRRHSDPAAAEASSARIWVAFTALAESSRMDMVEAILAHKWHTSVAQGDDLFRKTPAQIAAALLTDLKEYARTGTDWHSLQPLRNVVYRHAFVLHALIGHKNAKERPPTYEDNLISAAIAQLLDRTLPFISIRRSDISDFLTALRKNVIIICSVGLMIECLYNEEIDEVTKFICTL